VWLLITHHSFGKDHKNFKTHSFASKENKEQKIRLLRGRASLKKFKWQYRTKVFNQNQVDFKDPGEDLTKVVLTGTGLLPEKKQNIALIILSGCRRYDWLAIT